MEEALSRLLCFVFGFGVSSNGVLKVLQGSSGISEFLRGFCEVCVQ